MIYTACGIDTYLSFSFILIHYDVLKPKKYLNYPVDIVNGKFPYRVESPLSYNGSSRGAPLSSVSVLSVVARGAHARDPGKRHAHSPSLT